MPAWSRAAGLMLSACWVGLWYSAAWLAGAAWCALRRGWSHGNRPPED